MSSLGLSGEPNGEPNGERGANGEQNGERGGEPGRASFLGQTTAWLTSTL
jgi:hypothetical protein